ncbi:MAG: MATE family efflux transporter, partial [Myxococcota bacterium]
MTLGFDLKRAREIIILAAPIVIAMVTQMGINVLDTVFVGKLDPTIATPGQAALGFGLPLLWAFGGSIAAIGIGTQVMTARRFGSGDELAAGSIMTNAVVVALSSSLVMSALAVLLVDDLFRFFTTDQSIIDLGIPYAQIRIIGIISMVTTTAIKGFFDGVGRTRIHMYAALMMNVTNIILNYVFIFGFGPIPSYAVTGAGIASTISTFVGLAMIIGFTFSPITRPYSLYNPKNINGRTMWELIKLSVPSGLAQLFIMSGVLMFLTIISSLDDQAISTTLGALSHYSDSSLTAMVGVHEAMRLSPELARPAMLHDWGSVILHSRPPMFAAGAKVIIDLLSLGFVTTIAFGTATATLVSQSMGRGKFRLAANYGWDSVKLGMYFYGGLGLLVMLFPSPFLD